LHIRYVAVTRPFQPIGMMRSSLNRTRRLHIVNIKLGTGSICMSNDRRHVYISGEYGPYVYEFDRETGVRTRGRRR